MHRMYNQRSCLGNLKRVGLVLLLLSGESRGERSTLQPRQLDLLLLLDLVSRRIAGRHPLGRVPGLAVGVVVHRIDLLQSQIRRLIDKEVGNDAVLPIATRKNRSRMRS